ncbi:MAG: oxidoreductase [Planctomycetaceae bacterium]|nr:oxidoreductase [Planctomycetaceae bacterium]
MNSQLHLPWLELSIACPIIAAFVCGQVRNEALSRRIALIASLLTFLLTFGEWFDFTTLDTFSAQDSNSVVFLLFGTEYFAIDELTAPLIFRITLLFGLTIAATMRSKASRFSVVRTLLAKGIVLAMLSCSSTMVLCLLLAISAILPWYEMRLRGRDTSLFTLCMSLHLGLMFVGTNLLWLGQDRPILTNLAAGLLVLSAMLRAGIFPGHLWIVDLFEKCTFGTAILFVAPLTGAYFVMRLVLPVVPIWALQGIAVLALLTALYAATMAMVQSEARRFFAYLFISQSSIVLAGLELANPIGMTGALCIWLEIGLSLGGLAITLRAVEARIGRISLEQYNGLFDHMPHLGSLFLFTGLASIGFPCGLAFVGIELLIEGTVAVYPLVGAILVLATAINGMAVLRAYFRIFTGTRHVATVSIAARPVERFVTVTLSLMILVVGVWPSSVVHSRYHAAESLLRIRQETGIDRGTTPLGSGSNSNQDDHVKPTDH